MYFLQQIRKQIRNSICLYNQEMGPGSHDFDAADMSTEAARREVEETRPETERLAEFDASLDGMTTHMEREAYGMHAEQGRITLAEEGEVGADIPEEGEGVPRENEELSEQAEEAISDIDEVIEQASQIAETLGFEEFQIESDEQAEEFRETLLQGLELTGNETPEELEALIQGEFETLKAQRLAELDALEAEIDAELENPTVTPTRRAELQGQRNAIGAMRNTYSPQGSINGPHGNPYTGGIGEPLTPELLAEYGGAGHAFVSWLQSGSFPVYNGQPNYCGQNCGEGWNDFCRSSGIPEMQVNDRPRHGYSWASICASRPNQFRQINCNPEEAPAGAIISYQQNSGGSSARQQYGHVEVALGDNRGYYFGAVASAPGGSQRPPRPGSYTIWMPTSDRFGGSLGETPSAMV